MKTVSLSGLSMNHAEQQKLSAWVQGHNIREDGTKDTFYAVSVDVKRAPMWHHTRGLSFTATGYGTRIPTEYMIKFNDKWRRVYCRIFSNAGTLYIGHYSAMQAIGHGVGLGDAFGDDIHEAIKVPYIDFGSHSLEKDYI